MTIEEKIKKLNSICNNKTVVWTRNKEEDLEFCKFINKHYNMRYDEDGVKSSYYFVEEIEEDGEYLEGEIVVTFLNDCYGYTVIPYSEFFVDDKVDKPLGEWTLNELKEHCSALKSGCNDCRCYNNNVCCENPCDWELDISPKPSLAQSEIDILKAIKVLYPNINELLYNSDTDMFAEPHDDAYVNILRNRLPSLGLSNTYSIDELLNEVE